MPIRMQYLESLDSVRVPWLERTNHELDHLQILFEVVLTLALGRVIVVPYSYAFDSYGFAKVAGDVLAARDHSGSNDVPFRLYLHNVTSYDKAIESVLARVGNTSQPFFSSMMPELQDLAHRTEDQPTNFRGLLATQLLDDHRRQLMNAIYNEFTGPLSGVSTGPLATPGRLIDLQNDFIDPNSPISPAIKNFDPPLQATAEIIHGSLKALGTFNERSHLRGTESWPNDPDGRTAKDIVSGEHLGILIEFVDTLYNRIVAGSIGHPMRAAFTTETLRDRGALDAKSQAQDLALATYARGRRTPSSTGMTPTAPQPAFDVRVNDHALTNDTALRSMISGLQASLESSLLSLMDARNRTESKGSKFWQGVAAIDDALNAGDLLVARRALESHFKYVGKLLGPVQLGFGHATLAGLGLTTAGATLTHIIDPKISPIVAIIGLAASTAPLGRYIQNHIVAYRDGHRIGRSLIRSTDIRGEIP
jgi:hypothetical protein